jgi:radical SAM superfamily enzyme YgiQ (UPF0313 family)
MKTVLLVNANECVVPYPVPPLGLALLAAALDGHYRVEFCDLLTAGEAGLTEMLARQPPDFVGVSIRNVDDVAMHAPVFFIDRIRTVLVPLLRRATPAPIILGGSGFTLLPTEILAATGADYGVVGEGEVTFPLLLEALAAGRSPASLPGVVTRGQTADSILPAPAASLAGTPAVALGTLISWDAYRQRGACPIQTKRGCVHRCAYCSYPRIEGRTFRCRTATAVVDEIERLAAQLGPLPFEFVDSIFNDPPGHAEAICREIIRRGLRVSLRTMGLNPANVTPELLGLMQEAGFQQVDCTPDSASPTMLRNLGKNFALPDLQRAAESIRASGMPCKWFFLLGGPGETLETLRETFAFIDAYVAPDDIAHLSTGLRIYPGTPLHETALREGQIAPDTSLLRPVFYVSPGLGPEGLRATVHAWTRSRPNCIPAEEFPPPPDLVQEALALRRRDGLQEPLMRTLLRLRAQRLAAASANPPPTP